MFTSQRYSALSSDVSETHNSSAMLRLDYENTKQTSFDFSESALLRTEHVSADNRWKALFQRESTLRESTLNQLWYIFTCRLEHQNVLTLLVKTKLVKPNEVVFKMALQVIKKSKIPQFPVKLKQKFKGSKTILKDHFTKRESVSANLNKIHFVTWEVPKTSKKWVFISCLARKKIEQLVFSCLLPFIMWADSQNFVLRNGGNFKNFK